MVLRHLVEPAGHLRNLEGSNTNPSSLAERPGGTSERAGTDVILAVSPFRLMVRDPGSDA